MPLNNILTHTRRILLLQENKQKQREKIAYGKVSSILWIGKK